MSLILWLKEKFMATKKKKNEEEIEVEVEEEDEHSSKAIAIASGSKIYYTIAGGKDRAPETLETIVAKTRRRAVRYFDGKEIKHRVMQKKDDLIEFGYFRRSGKPVKIAWHKRAA